MKFTDIFIKRPVLAVSLSILIVILGLQAIFKLSIREYPEMTTTVIKVSTIYPGANSSLVQALVTSKLEEAIASAENIDYISSATKEGSSNITVKMKLNTDPNAALADILSKVNSVRGQLPREVEDPSITSSSGGSSMMFIGFNSKELSGAQVTDYIERVVKPSLFTVNGIAEINIYGSNFGLRIWLDPEKLAYYKLSASQIMAALSANNIQTAAGQIKGQYNVYSNKVETTTKDADELRKLVIFNQGDSLVRLSDVAKVELDRESDYFRATANGNDAVVIAIDAAPSANPLTVAKNIYPVYDQIKKSLPPSINSNILNDSTIAISNSISEVVKTIIEASLIVLVVITLFLGSIRAILIPIITIPISIIGVVLALQGLGFSLNLMTLLGMILAIGLVVDDAIVVLENIDRHIKLGETPFRAAIIGTREIAIPVITMTIALCAVYSPMALMGGITGSLFKEFSLTLAGSVFISGIIALTLSPMMCSKMLKPSLNPSKFESLINTSFNKITNFYSNLLTVILDSKKWILVFAALIFVSLPILFKGLSSELTPSEDKGFFLAFGTTSANKSLDYIQQSTKAFDDAIKTIPERSFYQVIAGFPSNGAISFVTLKDWAERSRSQKEIMDDVNQKLQGVPEINFNVFALPEINTGEQGLPVSIVLTSPNNYRDLSTVASQILAKAYASGKFIFASLDLKFDTAEMVISIDKDKANSYGIKMADISSLLGSFLSGATITRVDLDGRAYRVISQVERKLRLNPESFNNYYLKAQDGSSVPLSSLINMKLETTPASLPKFNQLNSAVISGLPAGSVGDAVEWFKEEAKNLPSSYSYDFKGEARQLEQEGSTLAVTFVLAVIIIFLVLAIQFESMRDPMVIIISVPLAISGALLVLNLLGFLGTAGATLNIYSEVGLITLVGLITKHGILMCEVAKEEQLLGKSRREAIMIAATVRLRPILMTTCAMIAGLIPLLYATGAGAVSRFSIGVVIISGLAIGTLFTIFVLPVIYSIVASKHKPLIEFEEDIAAKH